MGWNQVYNVRIQEADTERLQVQEQPELHNKTPVSRFKHQTTPNITKGEKQFKTNTENWYTQTMEYYSALKKLNYEMYR